MAAASYTTDLTLLTNADSTTGFTEPTNSAQGGTPVLEADYFIQGTNCVSKTFNATGVGGLAYTTTAVTVPTDGAVYTWVYFAAPNAIDTQANGGHQILIGSSTSAYKRYYVAGSNTYTYGGWVNYPVNYTIAASATVGSPTTSPTTFGAACNVVNAISKGNPFAVDAIRYGRGSIIVTGGDLANGYATFLGAANTNDTSTNRWGILSLVNGVYKFQGRLQLGSATTAVDFRDQNKTIIIQNTEFVTSAFNSIEILNAGSIVQWTNITILSLSSVSRGNFSTASGIVAGTIDSCTFTDMGTFNLNAQFMEVFDTTFRRCQTITQGASTMSGCLIDRHAASPGLTTNNLSDLTDSTFISPGTGHAIEITAPGTYTANGLIFTGYGATGTTNAAIYNNSGGAVTINVTGGGTVPTYRNGTGASTTVNASANVTLTGLKADSEVRAYVGTNPATATELAGTESSSTSFSFSQSVSGQNGYIQIFHVDYQPVFINITYSSSDASIPVQQVIDRQYARGTTFTPG